MDNIGLPIKNYCIIGVEKIDGVKDDIISISSGVHNYIEANNMIVMTFQSYLSPKAIKLVLEEVPNRTYFLFEVTPETSAVKIRKSDVHDHLFFFLNEMDDIDVVDTKFGSIGYNNYNEKTINDAILDEANRLYKESKSEQKDRISKLMDTLKSKGNVDESDDKVRFKKIDTPEELMDELNKAKDKLDKVKDTIDYLDFGEENSYDDTRKDKAIDRVRRIMKGFDEAKARQKKNKVYTEDELSSMSDEERNNVMNELLSKGSKMTDEDKKVLSFLVNKK